jgi:hypothetical protein
MIKATFTVVRAVSAEFARRALKPLVLIGAVVAVALVSAGAWLTTVNAWWWLLEALFIGVSVLFVMSVVLAQLLLRRIGLAHTKAQRKQVATFVDKLERSVETVRTPYPVILYYIIRDTVRPRPDAFVSTLARDSRTLGPDFAALRDALSET